MFLLCTKLTAHEIKCPNYSGTPKKNRAEINPDPAKQRNKKDGKQKKGVIRHNDYHETINGITLNISGYRMSDVLVLKLVP